jgi:tetratricopeptide (TPR) repeat protein
MGDSLAIVRGGRMRANALTSMGRNEDAITILNTVLPVARRHAERQYIYILNSLALCYTNRGTYDKALDYHFQSLELREKEGDKGAMSVSYNNIGLVYFRIKNYEKALE